MSKEEYVLVETASGYGLFSVNMSAQDIANDHSAIQRSVGDFGTFQKMVKYVAFAAFQSAEHALDNINELADGRAHAFLLEFLDSNLPKKKNVSLGVVDEHIAGALDKRFKCQKNSKIVELCRGIRLHFPQLVKNISQGDLEKAQLSLAHAYSRCKVKFDINRVDNMIIQSISLLEQLDKDINLFAMRAREWYSWHFPELSKIVAEHEKYCLVVSVVGDKSEATDDLLPQLQKFVDVPTSKAILEAAKTSMGTDISPTDLITAKMFAAKVSGLISYRKQLQEYLHQKMSDIAPNLSSFVGDLVGAKLISQAGSLINLAKCPASTVQILGAEKALFRALKTRSPTPKYGLIFNTSFISHASTDTKGRISRSVANKCAMAARLDAFSDKLINHYGTKFKEQVEERLSFYAGGEIPTKNIEAMKEVAEKIKQEENSAPEQSKKKKASTQEESAEEGSKKKEKKIKKKKDKKTIAEPSEPAAEGAHEEEKKKKKKKKNSAETTESQEKGNGKRLNNSEESKKKKKKKKDTQ